jgi:hypothetical protein
MITLSNLDFYYASPKDGNKYLGIVDGIAVDVNGKIIFVHDIVRGDSIRVGKWAVSQLSSKHDKWDWYKVEKWGDNPYQMRYQVSHRPKRLMGLIHI